MTRVVSVQVSFPVGETRRMHVAPTRMRFDALTLPIIRRASQTSATRPVPLAVGLFDQIDRALPIVPYFKGERARLLL